MKSYPLNFTLLFLIALLIGCKAKFPTTQIVPGSTTFTIDNFFTDCNKTANGTNTIDFDLVITVSYYDAGARKQIIYNEQKISSNPGPVKRPVTVTMNVPTNTFFEVEVNVIGKDCSRCASGWGGVSGNPQGQCNEILVPGIGYTVAFPRTKAGVVIQNYVPAYTISRFDRIPNVVNSCGCTVPF